MEITRNTDKLSKILKFITGGGVGLVARFITLYLLTEYLGVWYLLSAIIAYLLNNLVNFTIQKFWTFKDNDLTKLRKEIVSYVQMMALFFVCNTAFLYIFVEYFQIHYLIAQLILTTFLSIMGYLIQQKIFETKVINSKLL